MKPLEKLARDICWAEFAMKPRRSYGTKASYWEGVHPDRKREYIEDAEWLLFIVKRLKPDILAISAPGGTRYLKPAKGPLPSES